MPASTAAPAGTAPAAAGEPWLTAGVVSVGAASLLSERSHEMVTSLLPSFLTTTLGAGPAALAAIDGVADALTGVCKLAGGPLSERPAVARTARRRWVSGHRGRDRGGRAHGRGVAGRGAPGVRLGVPWSAVTGPGHAADRSGVQGCLRPGVRGGTGRGHRRRHHRPAAGRRAVLGDRDPAGHAALDHSRGAGRGRDHDRGPPGPAHPGRVDRSADPDIEPG